MNTLRFRLFTLLAWLLLLAGAGRLNELLDVSLFTHCFVAAAAIFIVCVPSAGRLALSWQLAAALGTFVALRIWWEYPLTAGGLSVFVLETGVVAVTVLLARPIESYLREIDRAAADYMFALAKHRPRLVDNTQEEMFNEIRRSRIYHHPLALLAVRPTKGSMKVRANRFLEEVRLGAIGHYVKARISEMLSREAKPCDIVVQCDGHFLVLLPETKAEEAAEVGKRIAARSEEELGLSVEVGVSTFPDQEVTLVGLLERASVAMRSRNGQSNSRNPAEDAQHGGGKENGNGPSESIAILQER